MNNYLPLNGPRSIASRPCPALVPPNCIRAFLMLLPFLYYGQAVAQTNPHPLMRDFIGVNTRASDEILFLKKFGNLREYHSWDIPNDMDNVTNCPVQKLIFSPGIDQSTLTNFDQFYGQLPRKVFPALKWLAPEMRGLQNYEQIVLEQKPWCLDGLTGIGVPPQYPAPALTYEQAAAPFHFDLISRDVNKEKTEVGNRLFKNYVSITPGQTYSVEVDYKFVEAYSGRVIRAWVDLDGNGTLDNAEAVFTSPPLGVAPAPAGTLSFNLIVPSTFANRCFKLRIAALSNGDPVTLAACASSGTGGGPEVFIYDVTLFNSQGTLNMVNSYCDPGVIASGFVHGFINKVTIKNGATTVYQKTLKDNPSANYFNDGSISNLIQNIGYKIKLTDSPDTKSATVEIDANLDGDFADAGESTSFPQSSSFIIPLNAANTGLTALRITNKNAAGQVTGIWEYPVAITIPGMSINTTTAISPLLNNSSFAATVQANDPGDDALEVFDKISLPVEQEAPATYLEYAKWVTAVAGRYGANKVCSSGSSPYCAFMQSMVSTDDVGGPTASGKKLLEYVEMGNEPDKYWYDTEFKNRDEAIWQMAPRQYAAVLDAAYDGAGSSPAFNFNNTNAFFGVKNIDPKMKVVMAGISEFRGGYLKEMNDQFLLLRANLSKKIPFDVINMHHYSGSTVPAGDFVINAWGPPYDFEGLNGGRGYCPEHAQLKERYAAFIARMLGENTDPGIQAELQNMEYWLSEFGYSTNDLSTLKSRLESDETGSANVSQSYFKTQAQWLVRSLLELSAMEYITPVSQKKIVLSKAQLYELRDYQQNKPLDMANPNFDAGGNLFSHHGLLTLDFKPKKSWYYVQTTKNVLGATRFIKDVNPVEDPNQQNYTQLQFDNGGEAPRIYLYQTSGGEQILAIWSPTANKSEDKTLKINIPGWLALRVPGLSASTDKYTIIQIKDNSESGVRSGHDTKVINGDNYMVFDGVNAPVYISETPIFVLLGGKLSDAEVPCPLKEGELVVTPHCNSALLQWTTPQAGSWRIFVAKATDLAVAPADYPYVDLLGNPFVTTQTYDLSASRTRFLMEDLLPGTNYVVFMLYVNLNRVPALYPCVQTFTTSANSTCIINPCVKVEKVVGSPSCDNGSFDGCNLVPPNTSGSSCFGAGDCTSGDPALSITCASYLPFADLTGPMFQSNHLWAGCSPFEVVVTFKDLVRLDAIRFFHLTGNDEVAIYYTTCECPNEKRYLTTYKPNANSYASWVSLTNNLPTLPVKKLYFKKLASNHSKTPYVVIGLLHFCGEITTQCGALSSGVLDDGPIKKGAFSDVRTDLVADKEVGLYWKPVARVAKHEEYGTYNQYELYVAKKIPGQTTQFDLTAPIRIYHPEGEEEATAFLNELEPEVAYDALLRTLGTVEPCDYTVLPSDKLRQSMAYGLTDDIVADTLISFVTNPVKKEGDPKDRVHPKSTIDLGTTDQMLLYPNPTDGTVYANWNGNYERLQVWTLEGVLYKDLVLKAEVQEMLINLSDAPPGLYLVQLTGKNRQTLQKKLTLIH